MSGPLPTLTVVVPSHNRPLKLKKLLAHLNKGIALPDEVILVDDGSNPSIEGNLNVNEYAFPIKLVTNAVSKGAPTARNRGAEAVSSEITLFLDDDIYLEEHAISDHKRIHKLNPEESYAISGQVIFDPELKRTVLLHFLEELGAYRWLGKRSETELFYSGVVTANLSIKTSFLKGKELFQVNFPFNRNEDTEFGLRMVRQGLRPRYHYGPRGRHDSPLTLSDYISILEKGGQSKAFWTVNMPDDSTRALSLDKWLTMDRNIAAVAERGHILVNQLGTDFCERGVLDVSHCEKKIFFDIANDWFFAIEINSLLRKWKSDYPDLVTLQHALNQTGTNASTFEKVMWDLLKDMSFYPLEYSWAARAFELGLHTKVVERFESHEHIWSKLLSAQCFIEMKEYSKAGKLLEALFMQTLNPTLISLEQNKKVCGLISKLIALDVSAIDKMIADKVQIANSLKSRKKIAEMDYWEYEANYESLLAKEKATLNESVLRELKNLQISINEMRGNGLNHRKLSMLGKLWTKSPAQVYAYLKKSF